MDADDVSGIDLAVETWLDNALPEYGDLLQQATAERRDVPEYLLYELYALSRISDLLLIESYPEPRYLSLFGALGMREVDAVDFDPFLHEIAEIEQAPDPDAPITLVDTLTPALMLGEMLFCRARVRVRAGSLHAALGWANSSPLYWTFRRDGRPTVDLSQGWGHNSQWRTDFRRDYRTADADHLNIDEFDSPDDLRDDCKLELLLTPDERRALVRHRCLLRPPAALAELAAHRRWEIDLFPFNWTLTCSRGPTGASGDERVDFEA